MLASYLIAAVVLALVLCVWVLVQLGWRRVFGRTGPDPDVLAGRMGCGGCGGHHEE
jgi:hypothetical protein